MKIKSYAKINLTLDVLGVRADGYHQLSMIMHSVGLYDEITLLPNSDDGIALTANLPFLPTDRKNHAYKAAELFYQETGLSQCGISIHINKKIPVCAGLAGGSSNAAAVLRGMNQLYHTNLSTEQLCQIGLKIGADVPYCITGGTALAGGIGEELTPLPPLPKMPILLAKPACGLSTPAVFQQWDRLEQPVHPDTKAMISALEDGRKQQIGRLLCNSLEQPAFAYLQERGYHNQMPMLKEAMLRYGAYGSLMSGSGTTVYGLFPSRKQAYEAMKKLRKKVKFIVLTTT